MWLLIKHLSSHGHKGAVLSTHECSGAFLDTKEQLRESCHGTRSDLECSWVLTSAQECSLCHRTMLKSVFDWPWLPMSTEECSLVLMNAPEQPSTFIIMAPWTLRRTNEHSSVLMGSHGRSYAPLSMVPWHSEHSWALVSTHEHSTSLLVPWQLSLDCSLVH